MALGSQVEILSAEWINERVKNVLDRVYIMLDHIVDEGLMSSGFLPLEEPIDVEFLSKLTEQQAAALIEMEKNPESKEVLKAAIAQLQVGEGLLDTKQGDILAKEY